MGFNYDEKRKDLEVEILAKIGPCPEQVKVYYGYKNGKATEYKTRREAELDNKFVETAILNKDEIAAYWKKHLELVSVLTKEWHEWLRGEYSHLNDETYSICYSQAYEDGHSSGYDEVANYMITYVDMAEKIIKANKK